MSKVLTDQIEKRTGGTAMDLPTTGKWPTANIADDAVTATQILDSTITTAKMATDPTNASNLSSGSVPAAQLGNAPATDVSGLKEDIALIAFKTQANGSLAKYALVDQVVDAFEDTSGIDLSGSTNEIRNLGNYIIGGTAGSSARVKLTSGTSWTVPTGVYNAEVFAVAGGGGGGTGGGGGGGGIVHDTNHVLTAAASVTYAIGAAGVGGTYTSAAGYNNGGNTTFSTLTAVGGGGGAIRGTPVAGQNGGSGGGGDYAAIAAGISTQQTAGTASSGTITSYGNPGGYAYDGYPAQLLEGGGGGAGEPGEIAQFPERSGNGGSGLFVQPALDESDNQGWLSAGGAGSRHHSYGGAYGMPGYGGGKAGSGTGGAATARAYGAGGGGANTTPGSVGGAAAAGVVYIVYTPITEAALTLVSTATEAASAPTKGDVVMTYSDGVGTTTLNTDLTAEISADDGSTWTSVTLASQGTSGGHTIVTANEVTISSTISTPADMRYRIKTINQSSSKQTRIHAMSLGWS